MTTILVLGSTIRRIRNLACRLAAVLMCLAPTGAYSQLLEFSESFSGNGPFGVEGGFPFEEGFESDGWIVRFTGGVWEFQDGGLFFEHVGEIGNELLGSSSRLTWLSGGFASFTERIEIRDLEIGNGNRFEEHPDSNSGLSLYHIVASGRVGVVLHADDDSPDRLELTLTGTPVLGVSVPKGNRIGLEINFDAERLTVSYEYDGDLDDSEEGMSFGPFDFDPGDLGGSYDTTLTTAATGSPDRFVRGILDFWSLHEYFLAGDFDDDGVLSLSDINSLMERIQTGSFHGRFDLNADGSVDSSDIGVWVRDLRNTYYGDANLDGEFGSQDLVQVFQEGKYENANERTALWQSGDWNGDGLFNSSDLVLAFNDGGYEQGARMESPQEVPEPIALWPLAGAFVVALICRRGERSGNAAYQTDSEVGKYRAMEDE